jgi:hypothetical protein
VTPRYSTLEAVLRERLHTWKLTPAERSAEDAEELRI